MQLIEKECKHHGQTVFVVATDGRFRCRACRVDSVVRRRYKIKEMCIQYLGGSCKLCDYNKYAGALEFHHRDPKQKDFRISSSLSWDKIKAELDKCDLLCANCHREEHERLRQSGHEVLPDSDPL